MQETITIDDIIHKLTSLNISLKYNNVQKLAAFNAAYLVVTKNFSEAIYANTFQDPRLMEKLVIKFALYYFRAVEARNPLPEWETVQKRSILEPSKLFSLLLGANAHINHDLPLALLVCIKKPEKFETDFFHAQKLFKKSIQEILHLFIPKDFGFVREKIILAYTTSVILRWRKHSWKQFVALRNKEITEEDILKHTFSVAKRIQTQEKYLARYSNF